MILDIGCSSGRLLASLTGLYRCFGYELNETAARQAEAKGITILTRAELETVPKSSYDAVVMVDLFEHLQDPLRLLKRCAELLKPGGWLVLVTGDGDANPCRRDPAQFWYFLIIEHVTMLTRRHAAWLEEQLKLKLTRWETVCHYDWKWRPGVTQLLKHWAYWQFRNGGGLVQAVLRRLPEFSKAEFWPVAPLFWYSSDHVVAVFEK
jgi:2-polyprenyl-3-methyl-5-hydroxy-6-metoxy-1,4-benzoquinol methylase